jgi:hypothetical protein
MPTFKALLYGANFEIREDDAIRLIGFYVTRIVDAPTPQAASRIISEALAAELEPSPLRPTGESRIEIEEMEEVPAGDTSHAETGFVIFPMHET